MAFIMWFSLYHCGQYAVWGEMLPLASPKTPVISPQNNQLPLHNCKPTFYFLCIRPQSPTYNSGACVSERKKQPNPQTHQYYAHLMVLMMHHVCITVCFVPSVYMPESLCLSEVAFSIMTTVLLYPAPVPSG